MEKHVFDPKFKKLGLNIYEYDAKLAMAFQSDCQNILDKFKQQKQFDFTSFAQLWKDSCFISIFEGQEYIVMIHAFLENCYSITKKYLFASNRFTQVGALFILYALYYKQPINKWVKIRVTQAEAQKMHEIVATFHAPNSLDVVFIYNKMRLDGAFQYCAIPQPLGLEARFLKRHNLDGQDFKSDSETPHARFKKLMHEDPSLVELEETDDAYQKLAAKYRLKCDKLFVFPNKVGDELKKAYSNVFNVNLEESDDKKSYSVRNRAMANTGAIYRAERKVVTAVTLDTPSTSTTS